jgi:sugar/nucleoside kinase (ribokinase family)
MDMSEVKVLGAGSPMLDLLVRVDDSFINSIDGDKGGMLLVPPEELDAILANTSGETVTAPGGSAANTIFGLANLGVATGLLGKVGCDSQAELYRSLYEKMGGDVSRFKYNDSVPTGRCLSLVTPDSERTMRTDLGAAATLTPEELSLADFVGYSHLHMEGYLLFNFELAKRTLVLAKEAGCSVSLDMASFEVVNASKAVLPALLSDYVDIVFANEDEAAAFCGSENPDDALSAFSEFVDTVAVKLGEKGAVIRHADETAIVAANLVKAVDTTGAGDLWASGFLFGFLRGVALADCGRYGAIVASEVVQVMGATIPEGGWTRIESAIK